MNLSKFKTLAAVIGLFALSKVNGASGEDIDLRLNVNIHLASATIQEYNMVNSRYNKYQEDLQKEITRSSTGIGEPLQISIKDLQLWVVQGAQYMTFNKGKYEELLSIQNRITQAHDSRKQLMGDIERHYKDFGYNCGGKSPLCKKTHNTCNLTTESNNLAGMEGSIREMLDQVDQILTFWKKAPA